MDELHDGNPRRAAVWSKAAHDLVRANKNVTGAELRVLIGNLVEMTGNSRKACQRFARRGGIRWRRPRKCWTERDRESLAKLIEKHSVSEIAKRMSRSRSSVWHMIQRMHLNAQIGKDSFTVYTLATALHVRPERLLGWISRGWLPVREVQTGRIKRVIIEGNDFVQFCKKYTKDVVGDDLPKERLEFVCRYAFPASHEDLLAVRASKKERAAYDAQVNAEAQDRKECTSVDDSDANDEPLGAMA